MIYQGSPNDPEGLGALGGMRPGALPRYSEPVGVHEVALAAVMVGGDVGWTTICVVDLLTSSMRVQPGLVRLLPACGPQDPRYGTG